MKTRTKKKLRLAAAHTVGAMNILYALVFGLPLTVLVKLLEVSANGLLLISKKVEKVRSAFGTVSWKMIKLAQRIHPKG